MEDLAIHATSNTATMQRLDMLSKLGTVFDKINPAEYTMTEMQGKRQEFVYQIVDKQKELSSLKDKIYKEIATKNPFEDQLNIEHSGGLEPPTAASYLNQSSITEDSELRAANPLFAEAAASPGVLHEKHLYTLFKMLDTILFLIKDGGSATRFTVTPSRTDKDCQTSCDWPMGSIISQDSFVVQPNPELSAIERKRLSLEQRIRARKSMVQDSGSMNQEQELKRLRYEIEMLQKKLTAAEEEKALADLKVEEQDLNIQEQFDVIEDYSNEIKERTVREKEQAKRIQELEEEVHRLLDQRRSDNFASANIAKTGKEEKDKPAATMPAVVEDDKNEISSCSSDDVASPEQKDKAEKGASDGDELDCATDLNKLKEDMEWINLQIEQEIPMKNLTSDRKLDSDKAETPSMAQSSSEVSTPAPDVSPNELGERTPYKNKSKGNFEFPEGGWECSKCQNYNFKGRKECNRCKKPKTTKDLTGKPSHLVKAEGGDKTPFKLHKDKKTMRLKALKIDTTKPEDKPQSADTALESPFKFKQRETSHTVCCPPKETSNVKRTHERAGDWICQRCNNHNFSFRTNCNMCHLSHELSDKMLSIYSTQRMPPKHQSQKQLLPPQQQQPGSAGVNVVTNALNDRVVHVHQYFNTYQMPNGGQGQQANQASQLMTPTTAGNNHAALKVTPTRVPEGMTATGQINNQTPQKVTNPMTPLQASPSPIFQCGKTGQKLPQWRPSNPQTGSTRQLTTDQ